MTLSSDQTLQNHAMEKELGALVGSKLAMGHQCAFVAKKVSVILA